MKQVIFNVGGGLSSYIEIGLRRVAVDIARSAEFSPVKDFFKPYFEKLKINKSNNRYHIDQLIISHPHDDHLSDIEEFDKIIYPGLLTVPNDNPGMPECDKINWSLIKNRKTEYVKYLREKMLLGRKPPLKSSNPTFLFIYYIPPTDCEKHKDLSKTNYGNNISLAVYLDINGHKILMPGDLMKDGMDFLIRTDSGFRNKLKDGVDYLIAPHHGLRSSFSTALFDRMKGNKTHRLNIVSEKPTEEGSDRIIDSRYSSNEFCVGANNLSSSKEMVYQRKTSQGHIVIDYSKNSPTLSIVDKDKLVDTFLKT
jgi:beta-lactamase superfamily II metal-dependent hydrolase